MPARRLPAATTRCPCGTGLTYGACCGRLHSGAARAQTAEQLMRSRFSAFAVGDPAYLLATWHAPVRPLSLDLDAQRDWWSLDILETRDGGPFDPEGIVEFRARFRSPEGSGSQHEVSRFLRDNGAWMYAGAARALG